MVPNMGIGRVSVHGPRRWPSCWWSIYARALVSHLLLELNMTLKSKLGAAALLVASLLLSTSCAANRQEMYLRDKARDHVYSQPITEVWPKVKELLAEEE